MRKRRMLSDNGAEVLALFAEDPAFWTFGLEIIRHTGIPSGSLYPLLRQFEERGLLQSSWEELEDAVAARRRPRKRYRLDPSGAETARQLLDEWQAARRYQRATRLRPRTA
jgi:PadR family transcriptional regulator PadR